MIDVYRNLSAFEKPFITISLAEKSRRQVKVSFLEIRLVADYQKLRFLWAVGQVGCRRISPIKMSSLFM